MGSSVISVNDLGKRFGMYSKPSQRLWEILFPFIKTHGRQFWALKNVSFDVKKGGTLGVIGRNGSGKPTLLQIVSGVLCQTSGTVEVNGKVSALLELGAGFHPEFSGRDNVYMNGAIMGLTRKETKARFEAIADFAEIGDFMEQPVKTYSSGMFVRLAFACAINVAPDILVIDEALSVGDAYFQHKCMNKIIEFRKSGGTIQFASHDMDAVKRLCDSTILLSNGAVIRSGDPAAVTDFCQSMDM
jgi:ABC-type polysaccharide/polyol phosphate transport system ATPase subunit